MQLAVISDLHLGLGDRSDAFGHDDADFLRFLDHLERNFERVVLLGDIWETLSGRRFGDQRAAYRLAQAAHPEIARRFTRPRYSYVHGNHDSVAGAVDGVPEELVLEADGLRLLFTHGHHHDVLVSRARWVSEVAVWLGAWLRRLGCDSLWHFGVRADMLRVGAKHAPECFFQRWAVSLARHRSADIVVTGHTHFPTTSDHGDALFLNSGSCSEGSFSFLALDTKRGDYRVQRSW